MMYSIIKVYRLAPCKNAGGGGYIIKIEGGML